jgi:nucleoside-diphosphate-sugar epimerase
MDISLARDMISYDPSTSLLEGLKQTWAWFLNSQNEYLKRKNYFAE